MFFFIYTILHEDNSGTYKNKVVFQEIAVFILKYKKLGIQALNPVRIYSLYPFVIQGVLKVVGFKGIFLFILNFC